MNPPSSNLSPDASAPLKAQIISILERKTELELTNLRGISSDFPRDGERPTLRILTNEKTSSSSEIEIREKILSCLDSSAPEPVLKFAAVGSIRPLHGTAGAHRHKQRPLCPGVAISTSHSGDFGTLGLFLKDRKTGDPVFITAGHVLRKQGASQIGEPVFQPQGHRKHQRIGVIQSISPLKTKPGALNEIDVAVVRPDKSFRNRILRYSESQRRCYWNVKPIASPSLNGNERLVKSGAASGFSGARARPEQIVALSIDYIDANNQLIEVMFVDQLEIVSERSFCENSVIAVGGDSGSVVIRRQNRQIVGMIFAGNNGDSRVYYVTPIQKIMDKCKLDFL